MSKKLILFPVLLIIIIFISGCIFNKNDGTQVNYEGSDLIPKTNLPAGFTYMGIHDAQTDIGGVLMNTTEGVYRNGGDDMYIQVTKSDNPADLTAQYKSQIQKQFKTDYNPFEEISINGHPATKITDFITLNGQQKPRYTVLWQTGNYMVIVGSSAELSPVIALATATGH